MGSEAGRNTVRAERAQAGNGSPDSCRCDRNAVGLTSQQEFPASLPCHDIEWFLRYGEGETAEVADFLGYETNRKGRKRMKKLYTVRAYRTSGCMGSGDGSFGPFESRMEAERTMASVAAGGKFQEVTIDTKEGDEEEDEQ